MKPYQSFISKAKRKTPQISYGKAFIALEILRLFRRDIPNLQGNLLLINQDHFHILGSPSSSSSPSPLLTTAKMHDESQPMIYLDWSGVDLRSNPLRPPKRRFDSRSATALRCRYILFIVSLGTTLVFYLGVGGV